MSLGRATLAGRPYSLTQCRFGKYSMIVGQYAVSSIDYDVVLTNCAKFHNIAHVINQSWVDGNVERRRDSKCTHPLVELLWCAGNIEQGRVDFEKVRANRLEPPPTEMGFLEKELRLIVIPLQHRAIFTLEHLDYSLSQLPAASLVSAYRKELRNPTQFWDAYSEIECAACVSKLRYPLGLKAKIGGRVIDFKILVNDSAVLVEVRAARPPPARFAGDKVPRIIKEKAKQFRGLPRQDKTSCVLIIDASGSAIEPSLQKPSPDSIPPEISAVLIYKMDFGWDGKPHCREKVLVENRRPKNALGSLAEPVYELIS